MVGRSELFLPDNKHFSRVVGKVLLVVVVAVVCCGEFSRRQLLFNARAPPSAIRFSTRTNFVLTPVFGFSFAGFLSVCFPVQASAIEGGQLDGASSHRPVGARVGGGE